MNKSTTNISILELLFSIVYVIYTSLHLYVYCYVGDYLSYEVSVKIIQLHLDKNNFSKKIERNNSNFILEHFSQSNYLRKQLVQFTTSSIKMADVCRASFTKSTYIISRKVLYIFYSSFYRCKFNI